VAARQARRQVAKFCAGWDFYDREELYDKAKGTQWRLARRAICEQVSALLGSFPNAPQTPEVFVPTLIEELVAANPTAVQLEAACRWLRRNCTFVPSVGEILKAIRKPKMVPCWDAFYEDDTGERNIIWAHKELEKAVAQQATSELVMALAFALLRADQVGGADALGEAMTAAEAQHGHRAFMAAFDEFERLRRDLYDGCRAHAIRELAEAMGAGLPAATRARGQTLGAKVQVAPGWLPPGQDAPALRQGKPLMRFGA
jgi:hypothetical protein